MDKLRMLLINILLYHMQLQAQIDATSVSCMETADLQNQKSRQGWRQMRAESLLGRTTELELGVHPPHSKAELLENPAATVD